MKKSIDILESMKFSLLQFKWNRWRLHDALEDDFNGNHPEWWEDFYQYTRSDKVENFLTEIIKNIDELLEI